MRRSRHSLAWRVGRAIETATASRPFIRRTGPTWAFALLGTVGELTFAPVVFAATTVLGVCTYLLLDAPWTKIRAQQRPRFVSVRILYLNTLILAGFWLAVMFSFSAADPSMTSSVEQRIPALLDFATASDFTNVVHLKRATASRTRPASVATAFTWFDVFLHGILSALTVNLILYGIVVARRRIRMRNGLNVHRDRLRYDATVGLFVDGESSSVR
jgi:hypothetical protein